MTIYYLYRKTHTKTGLKYLGQTSKDPHKYRGSGSDWLPHLKQFGDFVETEILLVTNSKDVRNHWGRFYSRIWNVVNAQDDFGNKIYANKIPETGAGGGQRFGWPGLTGIKNGMYGTSRSGPDNPFYGKKHTEEYITKSEQRITHNAGKSNIEIYGVERATQIAKASGDTQRGKKRGNWFNDGKVSVVAEQCPTGFVKGRLPQKSNRKRRVQTFKSCSYCSNIMDSSNVVSHEKRCFDNPTRIPYADLTKERNGCKIK
jgi:hypothetical protein